MDADGNTKDDLKLPSGTDEAEKLADTIQAEFAAGKELTVVVLKAMGESSCWHISLKLDVVFNPASKCRVPAFCMLFLAAPHVACTLPLLQQFPRLLTCFVAVDQVMRPSRS
jgi:Eukaryotic elongation factor 5A hypusine, DNA-binding OB fold